MSTTVIHLVNQIAVFTCAREHRPRLEAEMLERLDAWGQRNAHLANPLNRDPRVHYRRPRQKRLSGMEPVYGRFVTIRYGWHDLVWELDDFDSIVEMQNSCSSDYGILNCWTGNVFAFIDGKLADYELIVTNLDGSIAICDNPKERLGTGWPFDTLRFARVTFRWRR